MSSSVNKNNEIDESWDLTKQVGFIIIGNEVLSGYVQDSHLKYLADNLNKINVHIGQVAIIPDDHLLIVKTIQQFKNKFDYIFTSGGIGSTHDDITADAISDAFGVTTEQNQEMLDIIKARSNKDKINLNESVKNMAYIPANSKLIYYDANILPSFSIENLFCFPGTPFLFKSMLH